MPFSRKFSTCVLVLSGFALTVFAAAQDQKLPKDKQNQIEAAVSKFMATTHLPGVSVAVVENGEYEWASGYGLADVENNSPASEHTLFRLGSISKSLSAVGAMQLWERGKIDLDAPVQKYCPAFPQKKEPITTREVMGHLGGIRHYKTGPDDLEVGNTRHFDNPIQAGLDFFKNDPLVDEPGRHFHYSTQGYTLVGCVMEGASGAKYVDFMSRDVFAPAGMEHTQADNRFTIIPYRTRFYQKTESGTVENADFLDSSYKIPGGGWLSSAEDMAKFEVAVLHDKLIKRTTRDLMWTPLKPSDGSNDTYGLGWGVGNEDGIMTVGHTGGQQGTSTAFTIAPAKQAGVVVLTNMEGVGAGDLAAEILKILTGTEGASKQK
ncbi:MAG TPA: serine hydrolase domain-containing protein [Candidatus Sulfotelmatobacter sp.]|jgi:CubicO group peptidase (beta-lactamase class C family)|nr:serine hydrolase domain-containing protein [Candidatus Sulfotelmatobacter sp.]